MKKKWVFTGVAAALGALFLAGALRAGAHCGWFGLGALAAPQDPQWEYSYQTTWDPAQDGVEGIAVTWGNGPVYVNSGEGALITVTEYSQRPLEVDERLSLSSSGGVLQVSWDGGLLPLGALQPLEKKVVIHVPEALLAQLTEFSCHNAAGGVDVSGAAVSGELEIWSLSGDVRLTQVSAGAARVSSRGGDVVWATEGAVEELEVSTSGGEARLVIDSAGACRVSTDTGAVQFTGAAKELEIATVTGPVEVWCTACPEEASVRSVWGNVGFSLPEGAGFTARHTTVSGEFASAFPGAPDAQGDFTYGKGGARLSFATTGGDVRLGRWSGELK